jgi:Fe-S-cluster containining protein
MGCEECLNYQDKNCCQKDDILLTDGDIKRIMKKGFKNFYSLRESKSYDIDQKDDKNWKIYTNGEFGMQLMEKNGCDCIMLTKKGCLLSWKERPLVCRLYPFHYNEFKILEINPHECPEELKNIMLESWCDFFQIGVFEIIKCHEKFYKELKNGKIYKKNIKKGKYYND